MRTKEVTKLTMPSSRAERLAHDLFLEAGQFEGAIDAVWNDLVKIDNIISSDPNIAGLFKDVEIPTVVRKKAIDILIKENEFHPITKRMLEVLSDAKRINLVPSLYLPYKRLVDAFFQRVSVTILYAPHKDFGPDALKHLVNVIRSRFPDGTRPEISVKAEPQLVRGYKVLVGSSTYVDTSLATQFDEIARRYLDELNARVAFLQRIKSERAVMPLDTASMHKRAWDWILESAAQELPTKTESGVGAAFGGGKGELNMDVEAGMAKLKGVYSYVRQN